MYGVTQSEGYNLLGPIALTHGMLEKERDGELRQYLQSRCELMPELCFARTLNEYTSGDVVGDPILNDARYVCVVVPGADKFFTVESI